MPIHLEVADHQRFPPPKPMRRLRPPKGPQLATAMALGYGIGMLWVCTASHTTYPYYTRKDRSLINQTLWVCLKVGSSKIQPTVDHQTLPIEMTISGGTSLTCAHQNDSLAPRFMYTYLHVQKQPFTFRLGLGDLGLGGDVATRRQGVGIKV